MGVAVRAFLRERYGVYTFVLKGGMGRKYSDIGYKVVSATVEQQRLDI